MDRLKREPALIIGILAAAILAAAQSAVGSGVIGQDAADTITRALSPDSGWAIPIIIAIVTRFFVTSASAPALKQGTSVTVITPGSQPNGSVTV